MESGALPDVGSPESSSDFGFAFNDVNFFDRILQIEILPDLPGAKPDPDVTLDNWARNRKRRRDDQHSNATDKNQLIKQKNSSTSRRGDKRTSKVKHKNGFDSFSLKNGLVGFNSAAGGNNFFGMYGLKPEVFDITKYVKELSLHELLHGSYTSPCITKDKGKKAASLNNDLLQSVRSACSVLQSRKVLQAQNFVEADNSCIQRVPPALVTVNSVVGQTDGQKGDSYPAVLSPSSSNKVQESHDKVKMSSDADTTLYTPKEILERLALPPPKDLDLLLSDASKTTSSSKTSADLRLGKSVPHRTGLPPFPWSNSFSGHSKSGSDAVKYSTSRTTCQGTWVKVKNSSALQKGTGDLLVDFGSLAFDQSLVPSTNVTSVHRENKSTPIEQAFCTSFACSATEVPADVQSPTHSAAQTLIDIAARSRENPCAAVKLKSPSHITMKSSKSKAAIKRPNFCDAPNAATIRPTSSIKVGDYGLLSSSSKKTKLSSEATDVYVNYTEPMRKGKSHESDLLSFKPPPRKQCRDSNANIDSNGSNPVKKMSVVNTPRSTDRPSGSTKLKLWKSSRLEG